MAAPPPMPSLDPKDMGWVRWATQEISRLSGASTILKSNVSTATLLANSTAGSHATKTQQFEKRNVLAPEAPKAAPQVPTVPTLSTDHGTVTVQWNGLVHANLSYVPGPGEDIGPVVEPAVGFANINVFRATSADGPWSLIGGTLGRAGTVVDANVTVGQTYWYHFVTVDTTGATSAASGAASIVVKGVDLGTLDQDVKDALKAANDAAQAGLEAGQAGQEAAQAAQDAADSVAGTAADALQAANDAQQAAQSALAAAEEASGGTTSVVISNTAPDGNTTVLWIDTTNNANTPKRWNGTAWLALTDKAAIDAAAAAVTAKNAADAAQATANTAVTNAQNAQTTANNALTSANGKNKVYYQAAQPGTTGNTVNDLWFDTDDGFKLYVWNGTTWAASVLGSSALGPNSVTASQLLNASVDSTKLAAAVNTSITNAATAASNAQGTADTALTSANGKNVVRYSTSAASGAGVTNGDLWFQVNASNIIIGEWQWNGTAWVGRTMDNAVIANLDAGKITAGTIAAARIGANTITAGMMVAGTITAASGIIADAAITSAKIADASITTAKIVALDAGKITTGTLDSQRIAANSIAANQLIAGTITAASGVLADAVITTAKIADLAVNNAKIADLAVSSAKIADLDAAKIQAGTITASKLGVDSVTTNAIAAGSIDTNRIAAGAISADKLSLGVTGQATSPTNRVPAPLTDVGWWSNAISRYVPTADGTVGSWTHPNENVSAQTWGLVFSSSATARAIMGVMPMFLTPPSKKISIRWVASSSIIVQVRQMNGTNVSWSTAANAANGTVIFNIDPSTTHYGVYFCANPGMGAVSVSECQVFEVIGSTGGQSAEISPAGMRLYYGNNPVVDLTTNSDNLLSIMQASASGLDTVASIDSSGHGTFSALSANSIDEGGIDLIGALIDATPNGADWGSTPLFDRVGRGPIYDVTWDSLAGYQAPTTNAQYIRIAQDQFTLENGRQYMITCNLAGLQADLTSTGDPNTTTPQALGVNCYCEMQVNTVPNPTVQAGSFLMRAVVYNNTRGYWNFYPVVMTASSAVDPVQFQNDSAYARTMINNRLLPAGVPIYWQVNWNMSTAPVRKLSVTEFGGSRGVTVTDIGSASIIRPAGNDILDNATDRTYQAGGSTSAASGTTTTASTTKTWNASWSRSWNNSGSGVVSGTGTYTNGTALYQGNGASPMGSKFGFAALGLSGKTITSMSLYLQNTYVSYPGTTKALLGTHGDASVPGTYTGSRANPFDVSWSNGQGKWITVPSSLWAGFAAGTYRGFSLGVSSADNQYGYWRGVQSDSYGIPKLKVTYH